MLTEAMLRAMARGQPNAANLNSVFVALQKYGQQVGLDKPSRLAQYLAQVLHESGSFRYDRELWGPTPAQKRYEGRKDLGNVQKGDGSRFRGRTAMEITGRANYRALTKWARTIDPAAPNFEKDPDKLNTDPWEGLAPLWYWDKGNPTGQSLNRYADDNNIEMVTRKINGGLNGYQDRLDYYTRAALVLLGYGPTEVEKFQKEHPDAGAADGIAGVMTRMALHRTLMGKNPFREVETVEKTVHVPIDTPVVPETVEKAVKKQTNGWGWSGIGLGGAGAALTAIAGWPWQTIALFAGLGVAGGLLALVIGPWIVRRVKVIRAEVEG